MEGKDLALLLMIPVILGGILYYADSITGAVVSGREPIKIGEYSLLPSFKIQTDYNLDEYKELKSKLKNIIDLCKDGNMQKCLEAESKKLKWECDDLEEKILYKFTDSLRDCMKTDEKVVCQFKFDKIDKINEAEDERIFEIKISVSESKAKAELKEKGKLAAEDLISVKELFYTDTDYTGKDTSKNRVDSILLRVKYEDDNPQIQKFVAVKDGKEIKLFEGFVYKTGEDIKFIDDRIKDSFKAPEPANKIIKVPFTKGMKFCAKSKKEVFVYENDKLEKKIITYRFSVTFPKPIPPPLENFEAVDAVNAEKSAVFVWDAGDEEVKSYNLYYSNKNFIETPVKDIQKDNEIIKVLLQKQNAVEIDDIRLTECKFEPYGVQCKYVLYGKSLEASKLHYWKSQNRYLYYINNIEDGRQYYAAITAVDDEGNEIDNIRNAVGNVDAYGNKGCSNNLAGKTILMLGDSLGTAPGLGDHLKAMTESTQGKFLNIAKIGKDTKFWSNNAELNTIIKAENPDIVFISLGTNDANANAYRDAVAMHVKSILNEIGTRDIYWIGPPKSQKIPDKQVQEVISGIRQQFLGHFYDTYSLNPNLVSSSGDGIHPGGQAYKQWAEDIWNFCKTENEATANHNMKPNNKMIFTENKNYRQFTSKDDLAPMKIADLQIHIDTQKLTWTKPLKNADGTDSADVAYFNIYYKKSTNALSPHIEPGYSTRRITVQEANCANQAIACEYSVSNIPNLEKQIYSFAVTALDENVNEVSEADVKQMMVS